MVKSLIKLSYIVKVFGVFCSSRLDCFVGCWVFCESHLHNVDTLCK